ncbi:probable E3 SUMO-protein ligase RNF212 isoform X2 [Mugil cephalus]|uniref:probable E3 SUMO-protein ligase RNF212 isoform X2 n=1 Tax=Mugil cephalus TaxID=48193 RepID=UPI001FB62F27|nr:probable E3 SUMO-protein ligase RNF212 isoform X2 [Mugil cephalus]
MSFWVCCNSCFLSPSADRKLAVTSCGHIICSLCYQKGKQGECLICSAKCQVLALSDKSSSDVKDMFSDINLVASKYLTEFSKVIAFQTRHQKRLLTYYQQRNDKQEEILVKMRQEMQQMMKKLNEQSAYITKLENSLQHQSAKPSSGSHISHSSHATHGHKPVQQIPYNPHAFLSRHSSATNIENMSVDERSLLRKPNPASRVTSFSPSQDGRISIIPRTLSHQSLSGNHSARSATISRYQASPLTPDLSYGHISGWKSPMYKPPSSFRHPTSSLACSPH